MISFEKIIVIIFLLFVESTSLDLDPLDKKDRGKKKKKEERRKEEEKKKKKREEEKKDEEEKKERRRKKEEKKWFSPITLEPSRSRPYPNLQRIPPGADP